MKTRAVMAAVLTLIAFYAPPASAAPTVPAGFAPSSTSWTSPATGYVLGYAPCARSWCPALLTTADGGAHWQRLGAPPMPLPDNHNQVRLTAVDARSLYVSDGVHVQASRDGGRHWYRVTLAGATEPYYLAKIAEYDGRVFAVLSSYGDGVGSTRIYTGLAGSPLLAPMPGFAVTGGLTYGDFAIGGGVQIALGADYGTERYWTSADGVRFTPSPAPCPAGTVASLAGVQTRQVVTLCSSSPGSPQPGSTERRLWRAPRLGGLFASTAEAPMVGINQGFSAASPASATVAAEGGGVGFLHRTTDGGRTWTTTRLSERGLSLADLAFPASGTGVVVDGQPDASAGSAVYRTTDGGRSWRELVFG